MADKQTKLSIVIRTVDQATAKIKAINATLDRVTKPIRDFKESLSELRSSSGLDDVIGGFRGVGSAIAGILGKVALVGGVVGVAVAGLFKLVDGFDELGDKAEEAGVSVDFLAQLRYAAERSGASVEQLDSGLKGFSSSLGMARAGTGKMAAFLNNVSPALLKQLKATKNNEEAFGLLADAMKKIEDPAKRAAFAQKTLGDASLAPLLFKGSKGIQELKDRYLDLAGSQQSAAEEAGKVDDSMKDLKASTDGIKAALVQGLAPALKVIVDKLGAWFKENRANIAEWAASLGKKIPDAVKALVGAFSRVIDFIRPFVDSATKLKVIAGAVAAVIVGPLVSSLYALGVALLTTPVGWIVAGIAAIAAGAYLLITNWDAVSGFFTEVWDTVTGKFGWARTAIKFALAPIIGVPLAIIASWGDISDFFTSLWDGVTSVFQRAWDFISGIVDKVVGAVDRVRNGVSDVIDFINPFSSDSDGSLGSVVQGFGQPSLGNLVQGFGQSSSSSAKVTVDFANAPTGTRVRSDPQSTADVDLSVGYQMGLAP